VKSEEILRAIRDFLVPRDPVSGRRIYTDAFRRFVVGLAEPGQLAEGVSEADLADLVGIPLGTLYNWLHPKFPIPPTLTTPSDESRTSDGGDVPVPEDGAPSPETPVENGAVDTVSPAITIRSVHIQLIVTRWRTWEGTFHGFCNELRTEQRIPYGPTFIGNVLQGMRLRSRRYRIPVEAPWSSNTYRRFFPGAQWLGDGTELSIDLEGERITLNLETVLDVASNAAVGLHVSETESAEALVHAYRNGVDATGAPPLALTLDNKAPNHSPEAQAALTDTTVLRATRGRGQAKAPLEGAFGLFEQTMPPLRIVGRTLRERAASILLLVVIAFFRGRNGKPRARLGGKSPIQAYKESNPTPEEIQRALEAIRECERRAEKARLTREARSDPVRLGLLEQGLRELGIPDPERRTALSLACYDREAIARGLATFRAKRESGSLPANVDPAPYLGGIIRNLHHQGELERFAEYILQQRLRLRDLTLEPLHRAQDRIRSTLPPNAHPQAFLDSALEATSDVDSHFWGQAAAEALAALPHEIRPAVYRGLARRISVSFAVAPTRRADLIDRLAGAVARVA
jgi:transposase InsO family protein